MACKLQRRFTLRRKLHILRTLTKSKSVKKSSIVMDACLYIHQLRLRIQKEYCQQDQHSISYQLHEVRVEEVAGFLSVQVTCGKPGDHQGLLMSMLEVFQGMNVDVIEASFSCVSPFTMEAVVRTDVDAAAVRRAVLNVICHMSD